MSEINRNLLSVKYALRGEIAKRVENLKETLHKDNLNGICTLPFDRIINCNLGDPLQFDQKAITYLRQILSLMEYSAVLDGSKRDWLQQQFPLDVIQTAEEYHRNISVGPYTNTKGVLYIRQLVASFIKMRDGGFPCDPENIFLTNGASPAISAVLQMLIDQSNDAIMLPLPQYPLYSAQVTLLGGSIVYYQLEESSGWSLCIDELEQAYRKAIQSNFRVKALVLINPGNPTGNHLTDTNLMDVADFCHRHKISLLADEVYQENVYYRPFKSMKKTLCEYMECKRLSKSPIELYSFHSVSKGFFGECGRRGGYVECSGLSSDKLDALYKLLSLNLCSNINGQLSVAVMVNPPKENTESFALFQQEKEEILDCYRRKAERLHFALSQLPGILCNKAEGALYLFARLNLPQNAILAASKLKQEPDELYCFELLNATGICIVPGSAFGHIPGKYYVRITILPPEDEIDSFVIKIATFHKQFMDRYK